MSFTFLLFVSISTWKNETILTRKLSASVIFSAVQITTFLYRRQRWKPFDVAIVQKKKNEVRVSINHGRDLSLDAPGVVGCTLCPGVGLSIRWGSNDTLDVSSQNSTGQERENVSTVRGRHPSEGSWRNLSIFQETLWYIVRVFFEHFGKYQQTTVVFLIILRSYVWFWQPATRLCHFNPRAR